MRCDKGYGVTLFLGAIRGFTSNWNLGMVFGVYWYFAFRDLLVFEKGYMQREFLDFTCV